MYRFCSGLSMGKYTPFFLHPIKTSLKEQNLQNSTGHWSSEPRSSTREHRLNDRAGVLQRIVQFGNILPAGSREMRTAAAAPAHPFGKFTHDLSSLKLLLLDEIVCHNTDE